jgi:hypothetical protein
MGGYDNESDTMKHKMNVGLMSVVDELGGHQYIGVYHIRIF